MTKHLWLIIEILTLFLNLSGTGLELGIWTLGFPRVPLKILHGLRPCIRTCLTTHGYKPCGISTESTEKEQLPWFLLLTPPLLEPSLDLPLESLIAGLVIFPALQCIGEVLLLDEVPRKIVGVFVSLAIPDLPHQASLRIAQMKRHRIVVGFLQIALDFGVCLIE